MNVLIPKRIIVFAAICLLALGNLPTAIEAETLKKVRLGTGFIPNVQFAPIYVAQHKGFYAAEGLDVAIEYGFENDFVALAAMGQREFAIASGDQVILARGNDLPITYVMKWYQRYPVALVSPVASGIESPSDLAGKKIGLPGFYGTSFIGWRALVFAAGINEQTLTVKEIGYTQVAALQQGLVDAAMIYVANEPTQLNDLGIDINLIEVSDYINLVSNGMVAGEKIIREKPALVGAMARATLQGLRNTIAHPEEAFAIVRKVIPEMTDDMAKTQIQVLTASIALWQTDTPGVSDRVSWQASADFMKKTGLVKKAVDVDRLFTNQFVPAP